MKIETIAGEAFVRSNGQTLPLEEVLANLAGEALDLTEAAAIAEQSRVLAHHALAGALVTGEDVDECRKKLTGAKADCYTIAAQREAVAIQTRDLIGQHAAALTGATIARVEAQLADLAKHFTNALRSIAA
jgi:hypothetical protein